MRPPPPSNPGPGSSSSRRFEAGSPIDLEIRVMHCLGGPGIELQSPDVPRRRNRDRHHEAAKHIGTVALEQVGRRHRDDEVRRPELPFRRPRRRRRQVFRIALARALLDPALDHVDLPIAQSSRAGELAVAGLRLPRRHVTAPGHRRDLLRTPADIVVGQQVERSASSRPVTTRASREHDRGDVSIESQARRRAGLLALGLKKGFSAE